MATIIAVTSCATGIAHTYMAAEQLERTAKKLGHSIKVETQGAMGVENECTENDIRDAQYVILATGIPVFGMDRFKDMRTIEVNVQDAIRDPEGVFRRLLEGGTARAGHG